MLMQHKNVDSSHTVVIWDLVTQRNLATTFSYCPGVSMDAQCCWNTVWHVAMIRQGIAQWESTSSPCFNTNIHFQQLLFVKSTAYQQATCRLEGNRCVSTFDAKDTRNQSAAILPLLRSQPRRAPQIHRKPKIQTCTPCEIFGWCPVRWWLAFSTANILNAVPTNCLETATMRQQNLCPFFKEEVSKRFVQQTCAYNCVKN